MDNKTAEEKEKKEVIGEGSVSFPSIPEKKGGGGEERKLSCSRETVCLLWQWSQRRLDQKSKNLVAMRVKNTQNITQRTKSWSNPVPVHLVTALVMSITRFI